MSPKKPTGFEKQLRIVSLISAGLIIALMISTTYFQFIDAKNLANSPYNVRQIYQQYSKPRGAIYTQNSASGELRKIVHSDPSDDAFKFQRKYEDSWALAPVTGFYSIANMPDRGIEAALNNELDGNISELAITHFTDIVQGKEPKGADVVLSIDDHLQQVAYDQLDGVKGAVVMIEPSTGRILTMVSTPSYDVNALAVHNTGEAGDAYRELAKNEDNPLYNRAIDERYPPGSTFKVITSAAALETGEYQPDTQIDSPAQYLLPGTETYLPNYAGGNCRSYGRETLQQALAVSCNTAFAILGGELGNTKMQEQVKKFGVQERFSLVEGGSGIGLKSVASSFPKTPSPDKLAIASIGQGDVQFTVLQDALISAAVANRGVLMKPYLVDRITSAEQGRALREYEPEEFSTVFSGESSAKLKEMMYNNVINGVASSAGIRGARVGGKTGTAENDPDKPPHSWFTGFAGDREGEPEVAIAVFVENGGLSEKAAAVASQILRAYLEEHGEL
jgi:peptidoglycan glycosyltransferase